MTNPSIRSAALGLLLAFAAAGTFAATRNLTVKETVDVAAKPAQVWNTIKDFNGWQAWHPAVASTEITKGKGNAKGTVRILTTKDGAKITEELVSHSANSMSYTYRIIDSPLPVTNYTSTLKVNKIKTGASVVWTSSFKAKAGTTDDDARKAIAGIYRAGLDNLATAVK